MSDVVASCDAYLLCGVVSSGELYFRYDMDSGLRDFFDHRSGRRYTGAFDDLIRVEDEGLGMHSAFVRDIPFVEHIRIFL